MERVWAKRRATASQSAVLQLGALEQLHGLLHVAVVADGLVEVEDDAEAARLEPPAEAVQQAEDLLAEDAGALLQHALVEADADVVEAHRRDVLRVRLRQIRAEVLEVADREPRPPRLRQDVEALVVREPPAEAHAAAEIGERFTLHAPTFYPNAPPVATA